MKGPVLFCLLAHANEAKVLLSISASQQFEKYIHAWFYSAEILIIVTVKRCGSKNKKTPILYSCIQLIIFSKGHVLFCRLARTNKVKVLLSVSASQQFKKISMPILFGRN